MITYFDRDKIHDNMKDITDTVNDVCHVLFLRDKLCRKVAHGHVHNHSDSNVNTCMCTTL